MFFPFEDHRLDNVEVLVNNRDPASDPPTGYDRASNGFCAISNGVVPRGGSRDLPCGLSGRYVIVYMAHKDFLTLCEVEVYGYAPLIGCTPDNLDPAVCGEY